MIKYLIAILLTTAAAYSQTIKTLGYNTTNGQVAYSGSNTLTFTNPVIFTGQATSVDLGADNLTVEGAIYFTGALTNIAVTRTNLGLGWLALTNTNASNFRTDIGLGTNQNVTFADITGTRLQIGSAIATTGGFSGPITLGAGDSISFVSGGSPNQTRTNLGLGASWLTNTNVTNFRSDIGLGSLATNNSVPSGAATTNSILTADGAGGSAFVATLPKLTLGAGLATNPSFVLTGSSVGIYQRTAGELTFTDGTEPQMRYFGNNLMFNSDFLLAWGNSTTQPVTGDTYLLRDTTNTLASRNGTNPQTYNIYNTYSNSTNYERGKIAWTNNVLTIGTEKGSGGGTARALEFQTDGTTRMTIATNGQTTVTTGTLGTQLIVGGNVGNNNIVGISLGGLQSIGARIAYADFEIYNGTPSIANAYFSWRAGKQWCASVGVIGWGAGATVQNNAPVFDLGLSRSASGVLAIGNGTSTDASGSLRASNAEFSGVVQFGGTTTNFPALKRTNTVLQVRLADDSAYSVIDAQHRLQGTAPTNSTDTGTAGDMRYDTNNFLYICVSNNVWRRTSLTNW